MNTSVLEKRAAEMLAYLREHPGSELNEIVTALRWRRGTGLCVEGHLARIQQIVQRGIKLWLREDMANPYYKKDHEQLKMPDLRKLLLQKIGYREPEGSMYSLQLEDFRAIPAAKRTPGQQRALDAAEHRERVHKALVKYAEELVSGKRLAHGRREMKKAFK